MKVNLETLSGPDLDKAVLIALSKEGWSDADMLEFKDSAFIGEDPSPTSNWKKGVLIMERNRISVDFVEEINMWKATTSSNVPHRVTTTGQRMLVAGMRCYCISRLGSEIELESLL